MRRRARWVVIGTAAAVLLPVLGVVAWREIAGGSARAGLDRFRAELDETDPGWRLEHILAARDKALPADAENPIIVTEAVPGLLAPAYKQWNQTEHEWVSQQHPNRRPHPAAAAAALCAHAAAADAVAEARKLRDRPKPGGVKLFVTPDVISTLIPHTQNVRESASLLAFDATIAAYNGDPDQAVRSVHAGLLAARANGDEPFLISMLVRVAVAQVARGALERVLGTCEPAAGLAELQAAFAAEAEAPVLTTALRGERAAMNRLFENVANGTVPVATLIAAGNMAGGPPSTVTRLKAWGYKGRLPGDHLKMLETFTKFVEISRRPVHEQTALFKQVPLPPDETRYMLTRLLMPACEKVAAADVRNKAMLRATAAAIACERFRRATGRWPESLAEIPKSILPDVPLDAYDGKPLRYVRTRDGALVYSVGPDGTDDGGTVTRAYKLEPGEDYGFQLWDPEHRRAEPLPKPEDPFPDDGGP